MRPDSETLDKLYLEWSQFTGARTRRELGLFDALRQCFEHVRHSEHCSLVVLGAAGKCTCGAAAARDLARAALESCR